MVKSRQNKRRSARSAIKPSESLLHEDMKKLLELQGTQMTKFVPEVRDVPRIRFKRQRLFNVELSYRVTSVSSTTAPILGAIAPTLSSSAQAGAYTAIFDQYRILQVNIKFMPFQTAAFTPLAGSGPFIYSVIDYDDNNAPSSIDSLLSYDSLKITPGGQIDERNFVPHTAIAAYSGATFTSYAQGPASMFIDSASPSTQYFGMKYALSTSPSAANINFIVTMAVQFRNMRST